MSGKIKKSPLRVAARDGETARSKRLAAHCNAFAVHGQYNTISGISQSLLAKIPQGEANAIHMAELAAAVGCDERTLRKRVADLRATGVPVLSGNAGYWLPTADADELRHFVRLKQRQLVSNRSAVRPASRLLSEIEPDIITGQQGFDDL